MYPSLKRRLFWKIYGRPVNWKVVQVNLELDFARYYRIFLGLAEWVPSITNMLWYSFSSSVGKNTNYQNIQWYYLMEMPIEIVTIFRKSPAVAWEDFVNTRTHLRPTLLPSEYRAQEVSAPWLSSRNPHQSLAVTRIVGKWYIWWLCETEYKHRYYRL